MPAELRPDGDGWECPEHPAYAPLGLTQRHAMNSMAKHNREHHDAAAEELAELEQIIFQSATGLEAALAIQEAGYAKAPF